MIEWEELKASFPFLITDDFLFLVSSAISAPSAVTALKSRPVRGFLSLLSLSYHSPLTTYYSLFFLAIFASLREAKLVSLSLGYLALTARSYEDVL